MTTADLPAVNACLNGLSAVLLTAGWVAIRGKRVALHKALMLSALLSSAVFLTCYLVYHYHHGSTRFGGEGAVRGVYFGILITHVILATVMVPMILVLLVHALRDRIEKHARLARITLPIWLYVSVTGVVIYLMLYQIYGAAPAPAAG